MSEATRQEPADLASAREAGFRSTLARVLIVQAVALAVLGWLQARFGR